MLADNVGLLAKVPFWMAEAQLCLTMVFVALKMNLKFGTLNACCCFFFFLFEIGKRIQVCVEEFSTEVAHLKNNIYIRALVLTRMQIVGVFFFSSSYFDSFFDVAHTNTPNADSKLYLLKLIKLIIAMEEQHPPRLFPLVITVYLFSFFKDTKHLIIELYLTATKQYKKTFSFATPRLQLYINSLTVSECPFNRYLYTFILLFGSAVAFFFYYFLLPHTTYHVTLISNNGFGFVMNVPYRGCLVALRPILNSVAIRTLFQREYNGTILEHKHEQQGVCCFIIITHHTRP